MSQIKEYWRWLEQMRSSVTNDRHLLRLEVTQLFQLCLSRWRYISKLFDSQWGFLFSGAAMLWFEVKFLTFDSPLPPHCTSQFVRCDARFCLTYSNSLMRSPVPGYLIRLWLPELSSLALTNQFTPSPSTENLLSISSTNQKVSLVMTKLKKMSIWPSG